MSKLWLCVPCYREDQIPWVLQNLARQTARADVQLCIVENGAAVGACARLGVTPDLVVTSECNVSHARNAAVEAVKQAGGEWMAMWDDDDWYGPEYLSEMLALTRSNQAEVYGKQRNFVAIPGSGMFLFKERDSNREIEWVHGPSLVFRAADAKPFKVCSEGEEVRWCIEMRKHGARVRAASIHHLLYLRWNLHNHAWNADDNWVMLASAGGRVHYFLGPADLDVVCGKVAWQTRVRHRFPATSLQSLPPGTQGLIPLRVLRGRPVKGLRFDSTEREAQHDPDPSVHPVGDAEHVDRSLAS